MPWKQNLLGPPEKMESSTYLCSNDIHITGPSSTVEESPTTIIEDIVPTVNEDPDVTQIHTTGPSSTVEESPTTIIEDVVPTVNEDPDVTQIHTTGPSSTVEESPTMIIEDVVPTMLLSSCQWMICRKHP
ncbi:flocculation protein FLO11-like isoform X2 [Solanum lycopersicum]|uniref:flocculation protein FLO11-like isoform X2 n=1 Tax=Solanum lycopersicum TaxID=4081 RepID=UPI0037498F2C